jgi:hypothetical protein
MDDEYDDHGRNPEESHDRHDFYPPRKDTDVILRWWHVIAFVVSLSLAGVWAFADMKSESMLVKTNLETHETQQVKDAEALKADLASRDTRDSKARDELLDRLKSMETKIDRIAERVK